MVNSFEILFLCFALFPFQVALSLIFIFLEVFKVSVLIIVIASEYYSFTGFIEKLLPLKFCDELLPIEFVLFFVIIICGAISVLVI
jgi:hypothetical protein